MHILFEDGSAAAVNEILGTEPVGDDWYCVPSAIGEVIRELREEVRRNVTDLAAARRMEHRLLLLESLTAAQARGREFWSGAAGE